MLVKLCFGVIGDFSIVKHLAVSYVVQVVVFIVTWTEGASGHCFGGFSRLAILVGLGTNMLTWPSGLPL